MPTLLLTGFEPFHTHPVNPSFIAAQALHGQTLGGYVIEGALLPVDSGAARERLDALLDWLTPDAVLLTGLASGRPQVTLERVAVNVMDYRIPDNAGRQHRDVPVVPDGPAAYLSTLPLRSTLRAWREEGIPGGISDTAGTFVCNAVMYHALHALHAAGREDVPCGFLHLPANAEVALAEERAVPYLPQEELTRAALVAARAAIQ